MLPSTGDKTPMPRNLVLHAPRLAAFRCGQEPAEQLRLLRP